MTTDPMRFFPGAQAVDAGHLELLGKQAASLADAGPLSLADAAVRLLNSEKLSSEQVRRVVEFANTEAFNRKFGALDPANRVVDIEGGPADPEQVIQTLNNQARPQAVEFQSSDYSMPPEAKVAHEVDFGLGPVPVPHRGGVIQRVLNLQSKVARAHEETVQNAESARFQMVASIGELQGVVKTAVLDGLCREDLVASWLAADPTLVKEALSYMPRIPVRTGIKVAHRVNPKHPVVARYCEFAKQANHFATFTVARQNLERRLIEINSFITEHTS